MISICSNARKGKIRQIKIAVKLPKGKSCYNPKGSLFLNALQVVEKV